MRNVTLILKRDDDTGFEMQTYASEERAYAAAAIAKVEYVRVIRVGMRFIFVDCDPTADV